MCRRVILPISVVTAMCLLCGPAAAGIVYPGSPGWWEYMYTGEQATAGLDGTWNHDNGSDEWDGTGIGAGRPGGVGILTESDTTFARLQETGDPRDHAMDDPGSNRKIYLGHSITNDIGAGSETILDDGVTITFRARIPTTPPLDDLHPDGGGATSPWPETGDGYILHDGGKGSFSIRQSSGDMIVSFCLALQSDDDDVSADGLVMNKLNGSSASGDVDLQGETGGNINILELDPTVWHEFWITIQADPTGTGTHLVKILVDGSLDPVEFNVTAGNGDDYSDSYIALGLGATPQSGALDVDFFGYRAGIFSPDDVLKASNPRPADGEEGVMAPLLEWSAGDGAILHELYLGTNPDPGPTEFIGGQTWTLYFHGPGFAPGSTYYWRVDEVKADGSKETGNVWSFSTPPVTAWDPIPADGGKFVAPDAELSWKLGWNARTHVLYFGTEEDAVAAGDPSTSKGTLTETSFTPGGLALETTYYWRVDERDMDDVVHEGDVWSFTTTRAGGGLKGQYYQWVGGDGAGPPNPPSAAFNVHKLTRMDSQVDFQWGDLSPDPTVSADDFAVAWVGELEVAFTETYTFYTTTDDGVMLWVNDVLVVDSWVNQSPTEHSGTIDLVGGQRYSIVMWYYERGGGATAELRWSSARTPKELIPSGAFYPPLKASGPSPANGAEDVTQTVVLKWSAGDQAAQHHVFFGTDENAVATATTATAGIYRGSRGVAVTSYIPTESPLEWDKTYYWRIDEASGAETWEGSVWSFTTANYVIVDDFEDYNDYSPNRIFQTWLDGFGYTEPPPGMMGNGTGSTVGHLDAPYAEQTTIHGGLQSMPFGYDNTGAGGKARYSEAELEFLVTQNFSQNQVKSMSLWVHGDPGNAPTELYVGLQDSTGTRVDVPETNTNLVLISGWKEINIELSKFAPVNLMSVKKIYFGAGNRLSPTVGGSGMLFVDDIGLYRSRCVAALLKPAADFSGNCVVDYADIEVVAADWLAETVAPDDSRLALYYEFENNTLDSSGNSIHGTPRGNPSYGEGVLGQAISVGPADGNDYVDCGNPGALNFGTGDWSICAWVRTTQAGPTATVFANGGDQPGGIRYTLGVGEGGPDGVVTLTTDDDVTKAQAISSTTVNDNEWHHVVGLREGTAIRVYVDGVLAGSGTVPAGYDLSGTSQHNAYVGAITDNTDATGQTLQKHFVGLMDELRIYDYALSQEQVLYLAGLQADLNDDKAVDFVDFAELADAWLDELLWPEP
ncbi:MAG: hypothetical protein JSU70_19000 [Phycisphaerales bacterium]|nr:MAG: hypothetical protein JSU70_19000 [Phycisphaerales bacterium]